MELSTILDDYDACERGEFSLPVLAFTVATKMVEAGDASCFEGLPKPLRASVLSIAEAYRRDGTVISPSSTGMAIHDELGAKLAELLGTTLGG